MRFPIHDDIAHANTLPPEFYRGAAEFDAQRERIFARTWHFVGADDLVRVPGEVWPVTLGEGSLDEPIVFTRDEADRLHCLSNVCTHRANLVAEGHARAKSLRCAYHGRRFHLDGKFQFMPGFEGCANFPAPCDDLPRVPFANWGPWLFAAVNPAMPFDELIAPLRARLEWLPLQEFRFDASRSRDYLVKAHWALYCDNYLEGFHIPFVHGSLAQTLSESDYTTELHRYANLQLGIAADGTDAFELPSTSPDFGRRVAAYYYWVFPNKMFNFYPWGCSVNVVQPLGPELTKVRFLAYVWRAERMDRGAGAALDRVEREDEVVVEGVQRGIKSRFYRAGRFSPKQERGTWHFHRLLSEFIG